MIYGGRAPQSVDVAAFAEMMDRPNGTERAPSTTLAGCDCCETNDFTGDPAEEWCTNCDHLWCGHQPE